MKTCVPSGCAGIGDGHRHVDDLLRSRAWRTSRPVLALTKIETGLSLRASMASAATSAAFASATACLGVLDVLDRDAARLFERVGVGDRLLGLVGLLRRRALLAAAAASARSSTLVSSASSSADCFSSSAASSFVASILAILAVSSVKRVAARSAALRAPCARHRRGGPARCAPCGSSPWPSLRGVGGGLGLVDGGGLCVLGCGDGGGEPLALGGARGGGHAARARLVGALGRSRRHADDWRSFACRRRCVTAVAVAPWSSGGSGAMRCGLLNSAGVRSSSVMMTRAPMSVMPNRLRAKL